MAKIEGLEYGMVGNFFLGQKLSRLEGSIVQVEEGKYKGIVSIILSGAKSGPIKVNVAVKLINSTLYVALLKKEPSELGEESIVLSLKKAEKIYIGSSLRVNTDKLGDQLEGEGLMKISEENILELLGSAEVELFEKEKI